jgi:NAD(P)-dependent dehydrogenase (short-subunit alcohol dehydrogenase family)
MNVLKSFDMTGRVVVVTGGSRGLGLSIAESLGELGARVALIARNPEELNAAVVYLVEKGINAAAFPADLGAADVVMPLVEAIVAKFGRIDVLVNNAAASWGQPAATHSIEGWRKVMSVNVDAVFQLTQEIGRREFIPRRGGKVVNIASIGGLRGNRPELRAPTLAYSTSKGALVNFTRALAAEWGEYNINVNALCPGFFRSKLSSVLLDRLEAQLIAATPLNRLADEHDFAGAAAFLCSDASRHMTGQMLVIDGGMTAC